MFRRSTESRPFSRAFPIMLVPNGPANISGNKVRMSKCIVSPPGSIQQTVEQFHNYPLAVEIDLQHNIFDHRKKDFPLFGHSRIGLNNINIVGTCLENIGDCTEFLTGWGNTLQAD